MISRRDFLNSALAGAALAKWAPGVLARAAQPRTAVDFAVPPGACDCHAHVFDPLRFPYASGRNYSPDSALVGELQSMLKTLHLDRVVIVQPSPYGTDNACTIDALRRIGPSARAVAVIGKDTPEADLDEMGRAGVRGIRLNLLQAGITDPVAAGRVLQAAIRRIEGRGWHVQVNCPVHFVETLAPRVRVSSVPVVFDHFGGAVIPHGLKQAGFGALVRLVGDGRAYVKLAGTADARSTLGPNYADAAPFARELVGANSERVLWGSDWPHPGNRKGPGASPELVSPLVPADDGWVLNLLHRWVPEAAARTLILVENPRRLFGF